MSSALHIGVRPRILLLENTPDVARAVTAILERHAYEVMRADDDRRAAEHLASQHFDILLVEIKAAAEDIGLRFLRHVKKSAPHLSSRIVVVSHEPPPSLQHELDAIGICDLVVKPVHETEILGAIEECLASSVH